MTEEQKMLASKSLDDLKVIAVTFGIYDSAEADKKSREELMAAISGTPVSEPAPKPRTTKAKKAKAEKAEKSEKASLDDKAAEEAPAEAEVKPAPKKRGRPKKAEAAAVIEEAKEEVKSSENASEAADVAPEKKPARKSRKTSSKKADKEETDSAEAEAAPAEVPADAEAKEETAKEEKADKKNKSGRGRKKRNAAESEKTDSAEAAAPEETAASEDTKPAEEKPAGEAQAQPSRSKKRRISFGPSQETKQIAIEEGEETAVEAPPPAPEIQYTEIEGVLSIGGQDRNDFCGFVHRNNYLPGEDDAYVPGQMIKRMGLRKGDYIKGLVAPPRGKDKYAPLRKVISVNGVEIPEDSDYDIIRKRPKFEHLTAIYPDQRLTLETGAEDLSCRIIDLFCPIGKGQRGMIVSPPKAGKTILMQKIANAITANNPDCKVIVLLIDERPEEVTDMQRSIKGEVAYSTFDKRPENHVRITELVLERAMRLVEMGQDVVILLDSMTRLARAYNLTINPTGRTLSGGLDPGSLYGPKRFFGAARNIEFGGSLTIIATALIETGSRMDEVIFEEFKGTGNMEVVLDRKLADRRVYPAIAVDKSGTRREDLLLTPEEMESIWLTRKAIAEVDTIAATEAVINYMKRTQSNASFVLSAKKSFSVN